MEHKGAGAQAGYHDDRVMGMMLAYWNLRPGMANKTEERREQFEVMFKTQKNVSKTKERLGL